jgi:hypothetical protein
MLFIPGLFYACLFYVIICYQMLPCSGLYFCFIAGRSQIQITTSDEPSWDYFTVAWNSIWHYLFSRTVFYKTFFTNILKYHYLPWFVWHENAAGSAIYRYLTVLYTYLVTTHSLLARVLKLLNWYFLHFDFIYLCYFYLGGGLNCGLLKLQIVNQQIRGHTNIENFSNLNADLKCVFLVLKTYWWRSHACIWYLNFSRWIWRNILILLGLIRWWTRTSYDHTCTR